MENQGLDYINNIWFEGKSIQQWYVKGSAWKGNLKKIWEGRL